MTTNATQTRGLPDLPKNTIWMLSFGFLGVQIAFTLQSSQMSRIFQTLGADPHSLGWFFILPPLAGLLVQPFVGHFSDRTWSPRLGGRRLPFLIYGTIIAALVMFMLPNAGSFGFGYASLAALLFGAIMIALLDVSSNMAMQPFKMLVGDMVNEKQKSYAYGIQSFLCNTGSVIAAALPFIFAGLGIANFVEAGHIPPTVKLAFYIGGALLIVTTILSVWKVKEYDPATYAMYHGIDLQHQTNESSNWIKLLKAAPASFWTVTLVQFFSWFAFQYMWTYSAGAIALNVWQTTDANTEAYQAAGNWYGVLAAVQSVAAVVYSYVLAKIPSQYNRVSYFVSLFFGALGLLSVAVFTNQYALILSFTLIGFSWAGILTYPLTYVTNALVGTKHMGTYLGLFNGSICLPQIVASVASFALFPLLGFSQVNMFYAAGIALLLGALAVFTIKPTNK
ncbi:SLC45 family MFS transporter [Psittacicella hinzii]|uniref:MFS transporter n=1 Tax=Psittacicella hinzii TaxID=2028575 RepID=A0A3A1YMX3_9GAMM|nr:SLC45 family MFS transporter [Psittacicella hinzii]RIY38589.1 MFS transporter [Psittacicella hinzii]